MNSPDEQKKSAKLSDSSKKQSSSPSHIQHEISASIIEQYKGPIPSPSTLRKYEEIKPGFAERIVNGWENNIIIIMNAKKNTFA